MGSVADVGEGRGADLCSILRYPFLATDPKKALFPTPPPLQLQIFIIRFTVHIVQLSWNIFDLHNQTCKTTPKTIKLMLVEGGGGGGGGEKRGANIY